MNLVAIGLADNYDAKTISRNNLEYAIRLSDKELFIKFRDKKITYDQLRARGAALHNYATYKVLDDFQHKLNPKIMENLDHYKKLYKLRFGKDPSQELISSFKGPDKLNKKSSNIKDQLPNPMVE